MIVQKCVGSKLEKLGLYVFCFQFEEEMADDLADSTPSRPSAVVMFFKRIGEVGIIRQ